MSGLVLAFSNNRQPTLKAGSRDELYVRRLGAIRAHDPKIARIAEELIDDLLADCQESPEAFDLGGDGQGA